MKYAIIILISALLLCGCQSLPVAGQGNSPRALAAKILDSLVPRTVTGDGLIKQNNPWHPFTLKFGNLRYDESKGGWVYDWIFYESQGVFSTTLSIGEVPK